MKKSGGNFKAQVLLAGLVLPTAALVSTPAVADDVETGIDNLLFFRGGYSSLFEDRHSSAFTDTFGATGAGFNTEDEGWYVGAGFDFQLTRDLWGLMPGTWAAAELGLEYNNLGTNRNSVVACAAVNLITAGADCVGDVNVTMLTVSASPKIKFLEGSAIRPWIIPVGLDINVISPPSDATTVLDIGAQFGAGVDWEVLHGIHLGLDGRYHFAADYTDAQAVTAGPAQPNLNQDNDHWNVGGYLGIGF
jgi:hypothetical protein